MAFTQYLKTLLLFVSVITATVAFINYVVNPFAIFNSQRIEGINDVKPKSSDRIGIFKKYQPKYFQPVTLVVGNSRVEMGINPQHPAFDDLQPVYNLGVPGPAMRGQLAYAQNALKSSNVKNIFLALDFRDFLDDQNNLDEELASINTSIFEDKVPAILSLDALMSSIVTLFSQNSESPNRLKNGFNPANEYRQIVNIEGQDALFDHQMKLLNSKLNGKAYVPEGVEFQIGVLNNQIDSWLKQGVSISVFINPYHDEYYSAFAQHNLSRAFDDWRFKVKNALGNKVSFCDFTELGRRSSNIKQSENELMYFWEPTHYKEALGNIMIKQLVEGFQNKHPCQSDGN